MTRMFGSKSKNVIFDQKKLHKPKTSVAASATPLSASVSVEMPPAQEPKVTTKTKPPKPPKQQHIKGNKSPRVPFVRNKKAIGVLMIALSLVIALGVNPALSYFNRQQMTTAVLASVDIDVGVEITKEMLSEVTCSVEAVMLTQEAVLAEVVGKYVTSRIVAGEIISTAKLATTLPYSNAYLYNLPEGKKAMSISLAHLSTSVSAKLESGDIVSVYIPVQSDSKSLREKSEQPPELACVEVLSTTNVDGIDIAISPDKSALENPLPTTVTLAVDDEQAVILAGSETGGGIHIALVSRGDKRRAEGLLEQQAKYNAEVAASRKKIDEVAVNEK